MPHPNPEHTAAPENRGLLRQLGLYDSVAIIVGTIIGSGIFLVPGSIARQLTSLSAVVAAWVVGGALSVFGGLALAELGAAMPSAGGLYVYITRAYGRFAGFLYGWMAFSVIHTGTVATMAVGAGSYIAPLLGFSKLQQKVLQVCIVLFFTIVNCLGVTLGKWVQNALTTAKVLGLTVMTFALFYSGNVSHVTSNFWPTSGLHLNLTAFGLALIAVLWAYDGWHVISFTAGEVKNPTRTLPRSLIIGTLLTASVYVLANISYYTALNHESIRASDRVAAVAISSAMGNNAALLLSVLITLSILGAINGSLFTTPRVTWAMADDGLFFRSFAKVGEKNHTPVLAIAAHGIWAAALTLMGSFQELFTSVMFTAWIFYGISVLGVVVLRVREPDLERPYRCPLYPWPPILFVVATFGIVLNTVLADFRHAAAGLGLIAVGIPLFVIFRISKQRDELRG